MTNCFYTVPSLYSLIYVYEIPGSVGHAGILKVGDTTIKPMLKLRGRRRTEPCWKA